MKTETCKLYSRASYLFIYCYEYTNHDKRVIEHSRDWIFLPNIIKIDPYDFELYPFKVGSFFEIQCRTGCPNEKDTTKGDKLLVQHKAYVSGFVLTRRPTYVYLTLAGNTIVEQA